MSPRIHFLSALLAVLLPLALKAQEGPQLYNMNFDTWSKSGGAWCLYAKDAPASRRIWDSPNPGSSKMGMNIATPDYEHVAVPGKGKAAARIESRKLAWTFLAGNIFNGRFIRVVDMAGAESQLGAPFTGRPRSLSGYYHYIPKKINATKPPHESKEGKMDEGIIEVLLTDWEKPYTQISHKDGFIDVKANPHVIGYATLVIKKGTSGYVPFEIPFTYRSDKTPRYAVFTVTGSRWGGEGTGGSGTVIYVDEFKFNY